MKKVLILCIMLAPFLAMAQKMEINFNGGASVNSKPTANMYYKGKVVTLNYATGLSIVHNGRNDVQTGLQFEMLELSRKKTIYGNTPTGYGVINRVKYIYAKNMSSAYLIVNKKINWERSYVYGGLAVGIGFARNQSGNTTAEVPYKAPDGGYGISFGVQAGYSQYISKRFSLNVQGAARYYDIDNDAEAPKVKPVTGIHYRIVSYPVTIGLKYKFVYKKKLDGNTGETILY